MWLFKSNASWLPVEAAELVTALRIKPEAFDSDYATIIKANRKTIIEFAGPHDGRGFSIARKLRSLSSGIKLIASGKLTPDHARLCFQTGFDEILLDDQLVKRQNAEAWKSSLDFSVTQNYVQQEVGSNNPSIWQARLQQAAA
jgi:uncharacterized protein (DUF934 family)